MGMMGAICCSEFIGSMEGVGAEAIIGRGRTEGESEASSFLIKLILCFFFN